MDQTDTKNLQVSVDEENYVTLDSIECFLDESIVDASLQNTLRSALDDILQELICTPNTFAFLRDIFLLSTGGESLTDISSPFNAAKVQSSSIKGPKSTSPIVKSPKKLFEAASPIRHSQSSDKSKNGRRYSSSRQQAPGTPLWLQMIMQDTQKPITNMAVIFSGDSIPEGYYKIERTPSGKRADLNRGGRGLFAYLCVEREETAEKAPISELQVLFPDRGEFLPFDYEYIQRRSQPLNFNTGTNGEKVFVCTRRSWTAPIVDVKILFPKKGDSIPYGYTVLDKTPDGHNADLNCNSGGTEVVLCYRKKLNEFTQHRDAWLIGIKGSTERYQKSDCSRGAIGTKEVENKDDIYCASAIVGNCPQHLEGGSALDYPSRHILIARHLYPLLLACYWRNGSIAESAIRAFTLYLDAGIFDDDSGARDALSLTCLQSVVSAVSSICHHGAKYRIAAILPFFRKIIRRSTNGLDSYILHSLLSSLAFIGDYKIPLAQAVHDEVVYKILNVYEAEQCMQKLQIDMSQTFFQLQSSYSVMHQIVQDMIDEAIDGVEIAENIERLFVIYKSHASIHSISFCSDLCVAFRKYSKFTAEENAIQLLVTICKSVVRKGLTSGSYHANSSGIASSVTGSNQPPCNLAIESSTVAERDFNATINSLRILNVFLLAAGSRTKENRLFGHAVRRIVFSTVNSVCLVPSENVLRANLLIISTLWNQYRRHLKVELALLLENLFLRILRSNSTVAWSFQMDIMHGIIPWFQLPHNVVELFANFDMNGQFVQQWKIFEHFCAVFCGIAEGNSPQTISAEAEGGLSAALHLQLHATDAVLAIARSVMDASGHAHLISRDARTRHLSMTSGGWIQDESSEERLDNETSQECLGFKANVDTLNSSSTSTGYSEEVLLEKSSRRGQVSKTLMSIRMQNELQKRNQQLIKRAMEIASTKGLRKAIEYLCAMNFMKENPREISSFLRIYHDLFDESDIGDYLGEGDEELKMQVRLSYVRAMSFEGMALVESLRHFLTNGGFRLPGEAQKIERLVEAFAQCYFEDCNGFFATADTAMILSYSIIMLNTDLHNPQVKKNKMSKEQYIKNNRGIDNGSDLSRKLLEEIYDDIFFQPIKIAGSHIALPHSKFAPSAEMMLEKFRVMLARGVAQTEELMKELSRTFHTFHFVGVNTSISPDLIKVLFERVWFYFLALSTSILSDEQADLAMTMHCLDLLRFSISTCLFLGMDVERQAFCNLLSKLQISMSNSGNDRRNSIFIGNDIEGSSSRMDTRETLIRDSEEWLSAIDEAAFDDDPWRVMGDLHILVNKLKNSIQRRQKFEVLKSVYKRINRSSYYLKNSTQFLFEGDLTKRCRSRQKNRVYRFFLFNDQILYADKTIAGTWNPHNSLRLKLTRICDIPDSLLSKNAFHIINPVKSFVVSAENANSKAEWMRLIESATAKIAYKSSRGLGGTSSEASGCSEYNPVAEANVNSLSKSVLQCRTDEACIPEIPSESLLEAVTHGKGSNEGAMKINL